MIKKIEHIGIAVNSIDKALPIFEALFNKKAYKTEIVESEFVKTAFIKIGDSKIELLEATNENSAIAKFLEKNRSGFHHIAFDGWSADIFLKEFNFLTQPAGNFPADIFFISSALFIRLIRFSQAARSAAPRAPEVRHAARISLGTK
mgnify:CR=1 FL=1